MATLLAQQELASRKRTTFTWADAWKHRQGIVGGALLAGFAFMAIFGPMLAPKDPIAIDLGKPFADPVWLDS